MFRRAVVLGLVFFLAGGCPAAPTSSRSADRGASIDVAISHVTQPFDWEQSAGIFIGIEEFLPGGDRPTPVAYAADDATDLAYFFAEEKKARPLLSAGRTVLMLAGRPHKPESLRRLEELKRDATVIQAGGGVCLNAATIYAELDRVAGSVGRDGILIAFVASHGCTMGDQQVLLTSDSLWSRPTGIGIDRMLQALQEKSGRRLLLLVDACRTQAGSGPYPFEKLVVPAGYGVLSAASPLRTAKSSDEVQNGFFTAALVEGLRCRASAGADGALSPHELSVYVGQQVKELSGGWQTPESRFAGSVGELELVDCSTVDVAKLEEGSAAEGPPRVAFKVLLPDLFATVLVCSTREGICWNQNPNFAPLSTRSGRTENVSVRYGGSDLFQVWIALTGDRAFLRGEVETKWVPFEQRAERTVYWLGPMCVNK